jgi:hypothetical protein
MIINDYIYAIRNHAAPDIHVGVPGCSVGSWCISSPSRALGSLSRSLVHLVCLTHFARVFSRFCFDFWSDCACLTWVDEAGFWHQSGWWIVSIFWPQNAHNIFWNHLVFLVFALSLSKANCGSCALKKNDGPLKKETGHTMCFESQSLLNLIPSHCLAVLFLLAY